MAYSCAGTDIEWQDYLRKSVDLEYYPQILIDMPNLPTHRMHLG
jgi:hypothetical protein